MAQEPAAMRRSRKSARTSSVCRVMAVKQGDRDRLYARRCLDSDGPPCLVLGQLITEQLGEQPHFVPEVLEQAALGRAGRLGDLPGGDPADSLLLDQAQGIVKDALARRG